LKLSATAPEKNEAITTGTPVIKPYNKEKFYSGPMTLFI
jgi:hypothetical protein